MPVRLIDTTTPSANAGIEPLLVTSSFPKELHTAGRFKTHLLGMYFAGIGSEWDSGGASESNYLHHIEIALSGSRQVVWQGETLEVEPGSVYFWPGNTPLERRCNERCELVFFRLRCEWLPGVDPLLGWPGRRPLRIESCDTASWQGLAKNPGPANAAKLLWLQSQVQLWVARALPDLDSLIEGHLASHGRFTPAFLLVEQRLGADLRVEDLAKACGIHRDAFTRAFVRNTGITPKDFLSRRVNTEAIELVVNTQLKIKEIAHRLRFTDEFHFSRFFQKLNGSPPSRYRLGFRTAGPGSI